MWSPDGCTLAYSDRENLFLVDGDGNGEPRALTQLPDADGNDVVGGPSWAPDGTKIAFHYRTFGPGYRCSTFLVGVVNADGTGRADLARNGWQPVWSPDGTQILFTGTTALPSGGTTTLDVMKADGDNRRTLPIAGYLGDPGWQSVPRSTTLSPTCGLAVPGNVPVAAPPAP